MRLTIAELWRSSDPPPAPAPAIDPLTRTDALEEAQVLDVRLDGVHGLLGVQWHSPCRVLRTSRTPTPSAPVMSSPEQA